MSTPQSNPIFPSDPTDASTFGAPNSFPDRWHDSSYLCFDLYQQRALATAIYPRCNPNDGLNYATISAFGELGEFANKYKKCLRGDHGPNWRTDPTVLAGFHKELQGHLWYIAAIAHELNFSLSSIAGANIANLADRAARGTLQGSGDNR